MYGYILGFLYRYSISVHSHALDAACMGCRLQPIHASTKPSPAHILSLITTASFHLPALVMAAVVDMHALLGGMEDGSVSCLALQLPSLS